jgi:hypothetical protein
MLTIAPRQADSLRAAVERQFELRLLAHIEQFFTNHWRVIGPEQLRVVVRLGIERAREYRCVSERDVYLYVGTMLYVGSHFDTDQQLPWAGSILHREDTLGMPSRAELVYDAARSYMRSTYGSQNEHLQTALERVHGTIEKAQVSDLAPHSASELLLGLKWMFRRKFDYVGEAAMSALLKTCSAAVAQYGIATPRGAALYSGLMFMLGQGFDRDPQFPWAGAVLTDAAIVHPEQRVDRLYHAAREQLARWMTASS